MPRRRLIAVFYALVTLPLPACLHISARVSHPSDEEPAIPAETRPQSPRILFAELPRLPGTVVRGRPLAHPTPRPLENPDTPPNIPQKPAEAIYPVGAEPNRFPSVQVAPTRESPLLAAVRAYVENHPERAIEIIHALDKPNQEFVLAVLPILARAPPPI